MTDLYAPHKDDRVAVATLKRERLRLIDEIGKNRESIAALEAAIERIEASEPAGPTDEGELWC